MSALADLVPLVAAAGGAAVATGLVRALALRRGWVDGVDPSRRLHATPTPRLGGVGIAIGLVVGVTVAGWLGADDDAGRARLERQEGVLLVLGAAFALGTLDDLLPRGRGLPAWMKLLAQAGVGALAVSVGWMHVDGRSSSPFGALAFVEDAPLLVADALTVAWIVAVVNVVNFMDGSDALVATTAVVILAAAGGEQPEAAGAVLLPLAAATLGFLAWNAPPAKIFMGDGGSHLLGAAIALAACRQDEHVLYTTSPGAPWPLVGAALLPSILDVAGALLHKVRHRIPLARAHHDHLYQRLVKATGSHGLVALRYGVLALLAVLAVGPLARRAGLVVALAVGGVVLAAHLVEARRRTRGVARLTPP